MKILGIDPGIARTGWAVLDKKEEPQLKECGCIETKAGIENSRRLEILYRELQKIIKKYKPHKAGIEKLFFNTNAKTAFQVGEARGVVKICLVLNKIEIIEFTPLQIKNSVVGYGRADKNQVQQMVKTILSLEEIPKPDDAADAVAVALTFCFTNREIQS